MFLRCYKMNRSSDRYFREYSAVMAIAELSKGGEDKRESNVFDDSDTRASMLSAKGGSEGWYHIILDNEYTWR